MTSLSSLASDGLLMQDLEELVPGDDPVVVEVNPPKGQLYSVQLVRVDGGLFAAAEQSLAGLERTFHLDLMISKQMRLFLLFSCGDECGDVTRDGRGLLPTRFSLENPLDLS